MLNFPKMRVIFAFIDNILKFVAEFFVLDTSSSAQEVTF